MVKERAQKKCIQQSLEDIKVRMKEKRNKRLASASAPGRGRSRIMSQCSGSNSTHSILMGVQLNNKALAVAVQAEKEKVRQASAVILQLKREQQAMFLHLLLLKKKLKEQKALTACALERKSPKSFDQPQQHMLSERKRSGEMLDELQLCKASPIYADHQHSKMNGELDKQVPLPSTVGVRHRRAEAKSRRRSERVRESIQQSHVGFVALTSSPIFTDPESLAPASQQAEPEMAAPCDTVEPQHSTPEPAPPQKTQSRKQNQHHTRPKPEPAAKKPERGRKPERGPLKKPWENPKPRTRSKSRDRSATRAKAAPASQGNKLNTSLGFNDTFNFDCEETVHVTPFRAKVDDGQSSTPTREELSQEEHEQAEAAPAALKVSETGTTSPSSESEDSLYVPQRTKHRRSSPDRMKRVITRRRRDSREIQPTQSNAPKQGFTVFTDEASGPITAECKSGKAHLHPSADFSFSNSPNNTEQEQPMEPVGGNLDNSLPAVSPLVMHLDGVLSNFGETSCEAPAVLAHQTPQRRKKNKKFGLGVRSAGRGLSLCDVTNLSPAAYRKFSRPSDARSSTPVPARKRRCTMTVNYKEPSLSSKLRRGDKHTDLQFLSSPIFKQKSDRRSVQKSRSSLSGQPPFNKYNESFVGCR
ncbi:shugoshin 1 isoform X2 [Gouania willdenowi]|uniref:Shugoshin C-terminal domain-containing protein n=1 Tax=Gouania willdenowi TaxID=441366 RepID=A0A8C5G2Z8_GOUWI|nr:shugoshin 1 isoform X2 [Gouania willdenowi]